MKKLLLKSMLLLSALIVGSSSVWADDVLTLDCATPAPTGTTSTALSNTTDVATFLNSAAGLSSAENKITCSAKSGDVYKGKGSGGGDIPQQCLKVGKASGGGSFTFTIPSTYDEIGSLDITCYGWKTTSSISINSGTAQTFTTAQVETTKTFELANASRTIAIAVTSSAVCITEIVLKSAVTGEATTVTIDDSGITNTDIASGTAAGSLSAVVKNSSSAAIDGATVTWSSSKTSVATINPTTGAVTLVKKGSTTITASYAGVDGTYQPSSKTYVLNVTNSAANDGTSSHPFTVTEARDALDASEIDSETDYYVRGIIAKIGTFDDGNGQLTYWISDDGSMTNNVQCYKGKNVDGAAFAAATDLEVGDIATVKGKLKIYSGTTYELDENNEVVNISPRTKVNIATFTATTNPLILGITETTTTTVTNDQAGWTPVSYTYESDDETVATVNASGVVTALAKGTANITVTPVVSATDPIYKVGDSKSIEIVVSNPSHTASFSVNGVIDPIDNDVVEEGEAITFPADPTDIGGKKFVGWAEATIDGATDVAPTFVKSATMSTSNVTYYAVFANSSETLGWKKLAASEVSEAGTYALLTTDGHAFNGTISKGHGQVTTNAFSFTNNVATSAPTGTCELTLAEVTGGFTMYHEGDGYLYAAAASSGNLDWQNSPSSYWCYESENWIFKSNGANLRSYNNSSIRTYANNSGDVLVFAQKTNIATYSAYCTSIPSSVPVTITSTSGFATLFTGYALDFSGLTSEVKAYTASCDGTTVTLEKVDDIPANTGVVLKGIKKTYDVPVIASSSTAKGDLTGNTSAATAYNAFSGYDLYMLALNDNNEAQFTKATSGSIAAGKAFLKLSSGAGARELNVVFADDDVTGVNTVNVERRTLNGDFYNLAGQRVANPTKGLYIVNGKKVDVK